MPQIQEVSAEEISRQSAIMREIFEANLRSHYTPLAFVDTYGCQQNEADSEHLRAMLLQMGYDFTDREDLADLILINSCAVREHAELRVLGNVGALVHSKRAKRSQKIILCGCMVQQAHMADKIKNSYSHVDLTFGPHDLYRFPELLQRCLSSNSGRIFEVSSSVGKRVEGLPSLRRGGVKAWLSVMYGCNNFCSYCVVPYVRGRERSRYSFNIIADARDLIDSGYKDITLLGQNVNSYGNDLPDDTDFPGLIAAINRLHGDFLIRFMTSHPKDASKRLFDVMADSDKAAQHIHLPFQSGNNRVLHAMNRSYSREHYLDLLAYARKLMPSISVTSDVIVGFPGETDAEFEDTLSLIQEARFDMLFTFIYSPRVGTPAASLPDPVSRSRKQERFDRLIELHNSIALLKQTELIGKTLRVLIDGKGRANSLTARTNNGKLVLLKNQPDSLIGSFLPVKIVDCTAWSLTAELLSH